MRKRAPKKAAAPQEEVIAASCDLDALESEEEFIRLDSPVHKPQNEDSQDEVLALDSSDEDDEYYQQLKMKMNGHLDTGNSDESSDDERAAEPEEGWGNARNVYYNADDAGEEEDALEEEKEALRLQQQHTTGLQVDDYMHDAFETLMNGERDTLKSSNFEILEDDDEKIHANVSNLSAKDKLILLKSTMPDVLDQTKSFAKVWEKIELHIQDLGSQEDSATDLPTQLTFTRLLYLANIAFNMSLLADKVSRKLPVADRLQDLKLLLKNAELASLQEHTDDDQSDESELDDLPSLHNENETAQNSSEEESEVTHVDIVEDFEIPMEEYEPILAKKVKLVICEPFGESNAVTDVDMMEKMARKKSLKFHVNRIEKPTENSNIKKKYLPGDDDLPYKEKALKETPELSDQEMSDEGLEGLSENDSETAAQEQDPALDLYNTVKDLKRKRKEDREAHYAQLNEPFDPNMFVEPSLSNDFKRRADYKILANKGLTPHRKKELRNPRVKHRNKYEKALKRLSSTRAVAVDKHKLGKYNGEQTGIKTDIARSSKF